MGKGTNMKISGIPDDLYKSKDGTLRQKYDDNGHPSTEWLKILSNRRLKAKGKSKTKYG